MVMVILNSYITFSSVILHLQTVLTVVFINLYIFIKEGEGEQSVRVGKKKLDDGIHFALYAIISH